MQRQRKTALILCVVIVIKSWIFSVHVALSRLMVLFVVVTIWFLLLSRTYAIAQAVAFARS